LFSVIFTPSPPATMSRDFYFGFFHDSKREMMLQGKSGAWGMILIHEKPEAKISRHRHFKTNLNTV
jgi:hypothetical protein